MHGDFYIYRPGSNFNRILRDPQSRKITIKLLYFLDYLKAHGNSAHRFHKSKEPNDNFQQKRKVKSSKEFRL